MVAKRLVKDLSRNCGKKWVYDKKDNIKSMKSIKIIIEKNDDGFWAYAENEKGIIGGGETVAECKQDVIECIETLRELDGSNKFKYAEGEYSLTYKFDTASLLS